MNHELQDLQDRIARYQAEQHYEPADLHQILGMIYEVTQHLQRLESELARTHNVASCLANGIQPD